MTITFTEIVESEVPGVQFEINLRGGLSLPDMQRYHDIWILAERVSTGTSVANEVRSTPFGSESEAIAWFGEVAGVAGVSSNSPSPGAAMAAYIYNFRNNIGAPKCRIWGAAVAESAGVAATQTLTFANAATASGTFIFEIGGKLVSLAVYDGLAIADMPDLVIAAWDALPVKDKCPVTLSDGGAGVLNLTYNVKGLSGNSVGLRTIQDPSATVTTTATWGAATLAAGTLDPTLTTVLASLAPIKTALLVVPWDTMTVLEDLVDHVNTKSAAGSELGSCLICADQDTSATLATNADGLDDDDGQRVMLCGVNGSYSCTAEQAAKMAANIACETHLARSHDGTTIPGLMVPASASIFSAVQLDTLIKAGVTPLWAAVGADSLQCVRAVCIRTEYGVIDFATMISLDYSRDYLRSIITTKFSRASIVPAADLKTTAAHVTTDDAVGNAIYSGLKDLEEAGILWNVETYWESATVELDDDLVRLQIPCAMLPQWHRTYGRLDAEV